VHSKKEYLYRYKNSYISERSTIDWIDRLNYKDSVIWDIGANVGAYSLLMGKKIEKIKNSHIYAFEPESGNYCSLNRNIRANNLENKISAIPVAISNTFQISEFFLSSTEVGSATHSLNKPISEGISYIPKSRQAAIAISGDGLISSFGVPTPNYLKIDVDGHELEVVQGLMNVLKSNTLKSISIEIAQKVSNGLIEDMLSKYGFKVVAEEITCNDYKDVITNYIYER